MSYPRRHPQWVLKILAAGIVLSAVYYLGKWLLNL